MIDLPGGNGDDFELDTVIKNSDEGRINLSATDRSERVVEQSPSAEAGSETLSEETAPEAPSEAADSDD